MENRKKIRFLIVGPSELALKWGHAADPYSKNKKIRDLDLKIVVSWATLGGTIL